MTFCFNLSFSALKSSVSTNFSHRSLWTCRISLIQSFIGFNSSLKQSIISFLNSISSGLYTFFVFSSIFWCTSGDPNDTMSSVINLLPLCSSVLGELFLLRDSDLERHSLVNLGGLGVSIKVEIFG